MLTRAHTHTHKHTHSHVCNQGPKLAVASRQSRPKYCTGEVNFPPTSPWASGGNSNAWPTSWDKLAWINLLEYMFFFSLYFFCHGFCFCIEKRSKPSAACERVPLWQLSFSVRYTPIVLWVTGWTRCRCHHVPPIVHVGDDIGIRARILSI